MNANQRKSVAKDYMLFFVHRLRRFPQIVSVFHPWQAAIQNATEAPFAQSLSLEGTGLGNGWRKAGDLWHKRVVSGGSV